MGYANDLLLQPSAEAALAEVLEVAGLLPGFNPAGSGEDATPHGARLTR